jgi:hypothetical protein
LTGRGPLAGIDISIEGGDGADNQDAPSVISPTADAECVAEFVGGAGCTATAFRGSSQRLAYFAFGFEAIDSTADRQATLASILDYLQPCPRGPDLGCVLTSSHTLRLGRPGSRVTHTALLRNTGSVSDAYLVTATLGSSSPGWTVALPLTRTQTMAAGDISSLPVVVSVPVSPSTPHANMTVTATSDSSPSISSHLRLGTAILFSEVYLPLVCR